MAIKRDIAKKGRKVVLTREKGKTKPVRNNVVVRKTPRKLVLPSSKLGFSIMPVIVACCSVFFFALISLALYSSYLGLVNHPYFYLKYVEVQGNARLNSREILDSSQLGEGQNIFSFSLEGVESLLSKNPWVEEVSVKRVLPDGLVIGVKEKSPAFWRLRDGQIFYATADGSYVAPVIPSQFAGLPMLEVENGAEELTRLLPDIIHQLAEVALPVDLSTVGYIRLSASRGIEFYVEKNRLTLLIGLEEWLENIERLQITLNDLNKRGEIAGVREVKAQGTNVWVERRL